MIELDDLTLKYPELGKVIRTYYPVGIKTKNSDYLKFDGIQQLNRLIQSNILDRKIFMSNWENGFCRIVESKIGHKVHGVTNGLAPNYGGKIILDETDREITELHFYISFINNYFTIFIIKIDKEFEHYHPFIDRLKGFGSISIVVSPEEGYYSSLFKQIEVLVRANFEDAMFLSYAIDTTKLKGLEVTYLDIKNCQIGQAFFSKVIPFNDPVQVIGNINYGDLNHE